MSEKKIASGKELLVSFIGLVIAIILGVFALGIANWGMSVFGISSDVPTGAALIRVQSSVHT